MNIKTRFIYYRVLPSLAKRRRGKPRRMDLFPYSRKLRDFTDDHVKSGVKPFERGGMTICNIIDADTKFILASGTAYCSMSDHFSYRLGRLIAEGRARHNLQYGEKGA